MSGAKLRGKKTREEKKMSPNASRIIERAHELAKQDAFAPAERQVLPVSAQEVIDAEAAHTRSTVKTLAVFGTVCALVICFSLLLPYWGLESMGKSASISSPPEVLAALWLAIKIHVFPLFDHSLVNRVAQMKAQFASVYGTGFYTITMNRVVVTFLVILCGIALALSGLLFQTAFRNPLAVPSSLGVSDGVTLGCIIFSMLGFGSIAQAPVLYLLCVYGLGAACVGVVMFLSRFLSGSKHYNVLDMLLLGTIVCQFIGGISGYIQNFRMNDSQWYNFYDIQQATDALTEPIIAKVAVGMFIITFIPAFILRFKLNMISFSNDDGQMMGVRASALRIGALVLGSAMQLVAIATIGQVAMVSLAVPFVVRLCLPADFRYQFFGNCLMGTTVLLICIAIQNFAVFGIVTMPIGTIVSVFIIPFFVWMVAFGKGRW